MKKIIMLLVILPIMGCMTAPVRTDTHEFKSIDKGQVVPSNVPAFADCVLDGFEKSHFILTNFTVRQSRRSAGFRVESYSGGHILLMSADIFDDGRAELFESSAAALVSTSGEREAFSRCLKKHGVDNK